MARGSDQARGAATSAQGISNTAGGNAQGLYSTLAPELLTEATHPSGFAPTDLAAMDTAGQQSAGGTQAAAVGQGALKAARTRNAGGSDAAIEQSSRDAGEQLSRGALGTQILNAKTKEGQREGALHGLEGLFGTNLGSSVGALGQVASNINADTNAANASWDWAKYILDPALQAAGQGAGAAAGGCWIAEAIYGVTDPRTLAARAWLNGEFRQTRIGRIVMAFYLRFGQRIARYVENSKLLRFALKPIFDIAAEKGGAFK